MVKEVNSDFEVLRIRLFIIEVQHNLVVFRSDELRTAVNVGGGTSPETFVFAKNHWFCTDNPARSRRLSLPVREDGSGFGDPEVRDVRRGDLRLRKSSPVKDAGVRQRDD